METKKRWQFGFREAFIVAGCLGMELAIARALMTYGLPFIVAGFLKTVADYFLVGLPFGIAAGLIARKWSGVVYGTVAGMAIWFFGILLLDTVAESF